MSGIDGSILTALEQVDPDEAAALEEELMSEENSEEENIEYNFEF